MEKEIQSQYRQAQKEITSKWNDYMDRAGKRLESRQNALSSALRSGDSDKIIEAQNALESAKKAVTIQDAKYKAMVEDTALRISESNQTAIDYINDRTPNIYANNYNQVNGIAEDAGVQFRVINEDVVRQRIKEGDIKLPKSRLSVPKDVRWNTKKMNSAVLQGILQGESMNDIAKRLLPIVDNNASSAIRNARTLVTQAENSGRLDSYKALEEEGAVLKKVWMATPDERTRDAHLELDGQEVGIDEPFVDIDGNELMFPADPSADPSTVYNCRCTMVTRIEGVNRDTPSMHEEEIERERSRREEGEPQEEQNTGIAATETLPQETKMELPDLPVFEQGMRKDNYPEFRNVIKNSEVNNMYATYANKIKGVERDSARGYYQRGSGTVHYSLRKVGTSEWNTLAHECGHAFDDILRTERADLFSFKELDHINQAVKDETGWSATFLRNVPSSSDEYIQALQKDAKIVFEAKKSAEFLENLPLHDTTGLQDFIDGIGAGRVWWGHGDAYYNRIYNQQVKSMGREKAVKRALNELGYDASNQQKVKKIFRQYEAGSELWANQTMALTTGGKELEYMEKYTPNTLAVLRSKYKEACK